MPRPELIEELMNSEVSAVNQSLDKSKVFGNLMKAVIPSTETRAAISSILSAGNIVGLSSMAAIAGVTYFAASSGFGGELNVAETMLASIVMTTASACVCHEIAENINNPKELDTTPGNGFDVEYNPSARQRIAGEIAAEKPINQQRYVGYDMK